MGFSFKRVKEGRDRNQNGTYEKSGSGGKAKNTVSIGVAGDMVKKGVFSRLPIIARHTF